MSKKFNIKGLLAKLMPRITERLAENRLKFAKEYVLKHERYYKGSYMQMKLELIYFLMILKRFM